LVEVALEKEMLLLQKVNNMLNSGESQNKILNTITHGLTSLFNYHLSAIHILNEEKTKLVCKSYSVDSGLLKKVEKLTGLKALNYEIPLYKGSVFSEVLSTKRPMITEDIVNLVKDHTDKRRLKALAGTVTIISGVKYGVGVPLLARNKPIGVIGIGSKERITAKDVERLRNFGQQVGLMIEKARLDRQLKEYSEGLEKRVEERTKELKSFTDKTNRYLRKKTNQLLGVIGTFPFKKEEFNDASLMDMDPLGIVANSVEQVFENLERTNIDLEKSRKQLKEYAKQLEQKVDERTKELKDANELKDMFTDILRHDLLNPTGVIGNIAEIMECDEKLKDSQELEIIKRNVKKLEEIIRNASQYAKLESAEELEKTELDLAKLIENVIDDFGPYIKEKGMNVEFKPGGEHKINASVMTESVFSNTLSNAIKYSPEGTKIKIAIKDDGKSKIISFADQGEGVPDEHKEAIFDRFMRKDKVGVKGTGLGLAIVKRIVEMHGGRVWVEDNPGGMGSVFLVSLPKA
jgi:signal transduction histidine kinase